MTATARADVIAARRERQLGVGKMVMDMVRLRGRRVDDSLVFDWTRCVLATPTE
jgi:hypothetical protein